MGKEDIGGEVDKTTKNIRITGIRIDFLSLGQGSIDFIDARDLTREDAAALKEKYGRKYQIEIGVTKSRTQETYTLHARRKA